VGPSERAGKGSEHGVWRQESWQAGFERYRVLRERAESMAATLPPLLVQAERIAANGRTGRAWPPPRRARRHLLAVPSLSAGRSDRTHRLAPIGQDRSRVRARKRMGRRADDLSVARCLGVDALALRTQSAGEDRARRPRDLGARSPAARCRRACRAPGRTFAAPDRTSRRRAPGAAAATSSGRSEPAAGSAAAPAMRSWC